MSRKVMFFLGIIWLAGACKKNRVCNCHAVIKTQTAGVITSKTYDYSYTLNKVSVKTAVNSCARTKSIESNGVKTTTTELNCGLK